MIQKSVLWKRKTHASLDKFIENLINEGCKIVSITPILYIPDMTDLIGGWSVRTALIIFEKEK